MNRSIKIIGFVLLAIFFTATQVTAQTATSTTAEVEISDSELKAYATLIKNLTDIQMENQREIEAMMMEEKMDMNVYREVERSQATKDPDKAKDDKISAEDIAKYERISRKTEELRARSNNELKSLFENSNITPQRFQEINLALKDDAKLQERLKKYQQ